MPSRKRPSTSVPVPASQGASGDEDGASAASGSPAHECCGVSGRADRPDALLRAGLTALDTVRNDVVRHHTDMIERLLGIQRPPSSGGARRMPALGLGGLESFGMRKFEDVLDQRFATALQRLGYPDADELIGMRDEIAQLRDEVAQLRARVAQTEGTAAGGASPHRSTARPARSASAKQPAGQAPGKAAGAKPAPHARTRIPARKRPKSSE